MRHPVPLAGALLLLVLSSVLPVDALPVTEIRIHNRGAGTLDEASVRVHLSLKTGDEFDRASISRDVKTLQKTGRFGYVGAEFEKASSGVAVTYIVENKLRIRRLRIEGAEDMGHRKVREWLDLQVGSLVDDAALAVGAQNVEDEYRKRYYHKCKVSWSIQEDPLTARADVTVRIKEGRRASVRRIQFKGNEHITSRELLKPMQQRRWNPLSFLTKAGLLKPDALKTDMYTLKGMYLDKGFLDVEVGPPDIRGEGRKRLEINIPVKEGAVYRIRSVGIEGVELFPVEDVMQQVTLQPGERASSSELRKSAQAIQDFFGRRGYIRTRVDPDLDTDLEAAMVDVVFKVDEGNLAYIRSIEITGNTRTKDKVIRRELAVLPNEIYDEVKVRRSERRIKNLGYFSYVDSKSIRTSEPDHYDINFQVEEQRTGSFVVGFGFSSIDRLIGFVELSQGNFDLKGWPNFTGGGQKLKLRTQLGTERTDMELTFIEPWFLERKLSLQVDLFQHERRFLSDDYDQRNTGARIGLGKALPWKNRLNLSYGLEEIEVSDVSDDASDLIKEEEGERIKSALTLRLLHDSRDSFFLSTRGNRSSFKIEYAGGPLGGETDIYGLEMRSSHYVPLWLDHTLNLRGAIGVVDIHSGADRVPIFDRLFLGGGRTLRGFGFRDVGPKDENGEAIGGQSSWYVTAEYTVPVFDALRAATFFDIGMVYEEAYDFDPGDYNSDYGVGIRIDIPGFPLRFDYAWPLETDEFNDNGPEFNVSLGYVI